MQSLCDVAVDDRVKPMRDHFGVEATNKGGGGHRVVGWKIPKG
jgi:hypothetical protein